MAPDITCIPSDDRRYPAALAALTAPPRELYAIGDLSCLDAAPGGMVAIVGTREPTPYGERVARSLATACAEAGAIVVSGLARGVDSIAHEAAMEAGGRTVAVLGTGVDVPYPVRQRALHEAIARNGLLLSEARPGTRAFAGCFPRRNRIIAALAKGTVVVEAGFKSGALNTAGFALDLNRTLAAVPGPIDSPASAGCNQLIRDGAQVIGTIDDALCVLGLSRKHTLRKPEMGPVEAEVWDALGKGDASLDELADLTGTAIRPLLDAVSNLELAGLLALRVDGRVGRAVLI